MIRVAFDVHTLGQRATGNETYAQGLMQAFLDEPPADIDFVFYHARPMAKPHTHAVFRRLRPHWPCLRIPLATPWALYRDRIDVAHFQYFAPPLRTCPMIVTIHDLSFERHPEFFPVAMTLRMRLLMPFQARRASHIIAVSEATRRDIIELYGVAPARISVVHNGVAESFAAPVDPDFANYVLARFAIERPFIVCVGNLCTRKNQRAVVRAFGRLVDRHEIEHDLVLIGQATHSARDIMAEIEGLKRKERVHVTGFVGSDELRALYARATASVYVSLYEGFGLPIVESMACGTPVLTSSVSCMAEIAGDAALLVDPRDDEAIEAGLLRLVEDGDLRCRLGGAGRIRARDFSWSEAARRTARIYRQTALVAKEGT